MYVKIHHIGIAVPDLDASTTVFRDLLGIPCAHSEHVPTERASVSFFPVGESSLELVQPSEPNSVMGKFLEKRGPGIHHLCLEVDDLVKTMAELREKGIQFTSEEPKPGAHGAIVNFIHPKSAGGVLIELRQGLKEDSIHGT